MFTVDSRNIVSQTINGNTVNTIAFATMMIGMNEITTANASEFAWRMIAIAPDITVTAEDVKECVGLKTNATTMTMGEFRRHFLRTRLPKFRR